MKWFVIIFNIFSETFNFVDSAINYNVEIKVLINGKSTNVIPIINENTTFYSTDKEFLINADSLFKIVDVNIHEATNTATLTMVLIPKYLWNRVEKCVDSSRSV